LKTSYCKGSSKASLSKPSADLFTPRVMFASASLQACLSRDRSAGSSFLGQCLWTASTSSALVSTQLAKFATDRHPLSSSHFAVVSCTEFRSTRRERRAGSIARQPRKLDAEELVQSLSKNSSPNGIWIRLLRDVDSRRSGPNTKHTPVWTTWGRARKYARAQGFSIKGFQNKWPGPRAAGHLSSTCYLIPSGPIGQSLEPPACFQNKWPGPRAAGHLPCTWYLVSPGPVDLTGNTGPKDP
jgi:hypothetical protein